MKLKNKKTGEIVDLSEGVITDTYGGEKIQIKPVAISNNEGYVYSSLAELNAEWEDAPEEPKGYWFIDSSGGVDFIALEDDTAEGIDGSKQIGNYFETREEAELADRKLKAWKRLKDKGFKFLGLDYTALCAGEIKFEHNVMDEIEDVEQLKKDLDLLFGGEE